jgi:hypothetical protein
MLDLFEVAEEDLELIQSVPFQPAIPRTAIRGGG